MTEAPTTDAPSDPDAPYGYKPDGTPRRSAGGRPPGRRRATTRPPKPRPQAPQRKPARTKAPDYRAGVTGLLSVVALPLRFSGPAGPLDAATVMLHAEEIGQACQDTAEQDARFAALLDRAMSVGPYGALIGCALRLGAQIAENHQVLPPQVTTSLGAVPRDQLVAQLSGHVEQQEPAA